MQKLFIKTWMIYWFVIILIPVKSIYPATYQAFFLQLTFVVLVFLSFYFTSTILGTKEIDENNFFVINKSYTYIKIAMILSLIGFLFLIYDKVFIQGINYSEGLAFAREQWRQQGEGREVEVSSIFSVFGYLFSSSYFVAAILSITQNNILTTYQRFGTLLLCLLFSISNTIITGGRSTLFLFVVFILISLSSRNLITLQKSIFNKKLSLVLFFIFLFIATYFILIFYQRAELSDTDANLYVLNFLPYLGLMPVEWYDNLLRKLGLSLFSYDEWFLSGRFPSLPGAFLHQFGAFGFVFASIFLGSINAILKRWRKLCPTHLFPLGTLIMVEVILILSPLLFAGDFLSFPFILTELIIIFYIDKIIQLNLFLSNDKL